MVNTSAQELKKKGEGKDKEGELTIKFEKYFLKINSKKKQNSKRLPLFFLIV